MAAAKMLPYVFGVFALASYLELGAGFGQWCQVAIELGVTDSLAIDGPWTFNALCVSRSKFIIKDLGKPLDLGRRFDLALSSPSGGGEDDQVSNLKMVSQALRTLAILRDHALRRSTDFRAVKHDRYKFDVVFSTAGQEPVLAGQVSA